MLLLLLFNARARALLSANRPAGQPNRQLTRLPLASPALVRPLAGSLSRVLSIRRRPARVALIESASREAQSALHLVQAKHLQSTASCATITCTTTACIRRVSERERESKSSSLRSSCRQQQPKSVSQSVSLLHWFAQRESAGARHLAARRPTSMST